MLVDDLVLTKSLGKGSFGEVFLTKKVKGTTELYATKRMGRAEYEKPENYKRLANEISILKGINHPNIVKLIEVKKTKNHIYIVTEFCNGGSLFEKLNKYIKANRKPFSEEIVQYLMRQLVSAINYLHKNKIIHRDLKLDNILVNFPTENDKNNMNMLSAQVKLIDFGFATRLKSSHHNLTNTILGTPSNMEPHMLRNMEKHQISVQGYDEKIDIWSLGTLCYEMLVGNLTFYGRNMNELYEKVKQGNYKMPLWLSKEAVSFLNGMLQYDSNKRFSSDDLLRHDFLIKNVKDFQKVDKNQDQLKGKIQGNMMKINIRNNNTIWGLFNENNNFNSDKPLKEEATIKNAATMPNVEVSEKIMNNFDNQKQQNNIKNNAISFAQVKVIGNVKNPNKINNNINNNRIISAKRPVMQNNQINQIKHINNNKPSQIPKTAISSNNRIQKKTTFENNMNIINQNNTNKINNNQKILYRTNIEPKHHHHLHLQQVKNENPQQFQNNQINGQNNSNQVNTSNNNNISNQQNFPNVSQMGDYCKNKNNALNEFF